MIKAINITPLNTSKELSYKCEHCGKKGTFVLKDSIINTNNSGKSIQVLDYECPKCNKKL